MKLVDFLHGFKVSDDRGNSAVNCMMPDSLREVITVLGGKSFESGLYSVYRFDEIDRATKLVENCFSGLRGNVIVFGYDWSGRQFLLDKRNNFEGESLVSVVDLGGGDGFDIPASVYDFHNVVLLESTEDVLAASFYNQWLENNDPVKSATCIGYKVPLFLGGEDLETNLEEIDLLVYLELCGQLMNKVKSLPDGKTIGSIEIS